MLGSLEYWKISELGKVELGNFEIALKESAIHKKMNPVRDPHF